MKTEQASKYQADPHQLAEKAVREFATGVRMQLFGLDSEVSREPSCTCPIALSELVAEGLADNVYAMSATVRANGYEPFTDDVGRECVSRTHAAELIAARNERDASAEQHSRSQREINARADAWQRERERVVQAAISEHYQQTGRNMRDREDARQRGVEVGREFERNAPDEIKSRITPRYLKSWNERRKIREMIKA